MRVLLNTKELQGRKFYYADFGNEGHGQPSFRLWVHFSVVERDAGEVFITFPKRGVLLEQGRSRGTVVMRPGNANCFLFYVPCGYRGTSNICILDPDDVVCKVEYYEYSSPRGRLGVSKGVLVCVEGDRVLFRWERTGRTCGAPCRGLTVLYVDGRVEELDRISSLDYIWDLGEVRNEGSGD